MPILPGRSMNYYGTRRRGHDLAFHSELRDALFASGMPFVLIINEMPEAWSSTAGRAPHRSQIGAWCGPGAAFQSILLSAQDCFTQSCCQRRIAPVHYQQLGLGAVLALSQPREGERGRISRPKPRSRPCGTGDRHDPDFGTCPRGVPRKVPLQTGRFSAPKRAVTSLTSVFGLKSAVLGR